VNQGKPLADEGYRLMGAAFDVYNEMGGGLAEEIYQESLEIELAERGIPFVAQKRLSIFYKGRELMSRYVPDLMVYGQIVVESKAVTELAPEHEAQVINYMRISRSAVGYLINFAHKETLQWKRFVLTTGKGAEKGTADLR
jgi:GxxExxY protein